LAKLYVLGEKLMHFEFQDAALSMMMRNIKTKTEYPDGGHICTIYEGTMDGSPARRLLVDFFVWGNATGWAILKDPARNYPAEFLEDLVLAFLEDRRGLTWPLPWVADPASYMIGSSKKAT
ncbi:hypothetical protein EK21DRAFT_73348, partial [Setomelanomma holmii]